MAINKNIVFKQFNLDIENKTISLAFETVIEENGEELARKRHRCAFVPGDIEKVKQFMGLGDTNKHIKYINSIWTQAVIDRYQAKLAEQE